MGFCRSLQLQSHNKKGTSKASVTSTRTARVATGGTGVAAHIGLHALGSFADRFELTGALGDAVIYRGPGAPAHDRGKVLSHAALMLTGGGEAASGIEGLRSTGSLFGSVASDTTLIRCIEAITGVDRNAVWATLTGTVPEPPSPLAAAPSARASSRRRSPTTVDSPTLF